MFQEKNGVQSNTIESPLVKKHKGRNFINICGVVCGVSGASGGESGEEGSGEFVLLEEVDVGKKWIQTCEICSFQEFARI